MVTQPKQSKQSKEKKYWEKNKEKILERLRKKRLSLSKKELQAIHLKQTYNMTLADYDQLLEAQDGMCVICSEPPSVQRLFVDHNHETGEIRGLLCPRCNMLTGFVETYYHLLPNLLQYIKET